MFLRCQAHFSHSHRRRGLPGGPFFRRPARARIGVRGKEFRGCAAFHAPHARPAAPACERVMSFRGLNTFRRDLEEPSFRFDHLVHQTFKNENAWREDCMRRSCSCIQEALPQISPEDNNA